MEIKARGVEPHRYGKFVPVLVLSVTIDPEYKAIEELLPTIDAEKVPSDDVDKLLGIERWLIVRNDGAPMEIATAFIDGMGNARAGLATLVFLERVSPRYIFLCGIAGTLDPNKVGLGDVVVGDFILWWNLNKLQSDADERCLKLGDCYLRKEIHLIGAHTPEWNKRISEFVIQQKNQLLSNTDAGLLKLKNIMSTKNESGGLRENEMHFGTILSWDYVLSHGAIRDQLCLESHGALAVEMEGAGFFSGLDRRNEELTKQQEQTQRAMHSHVKGFVFRGISDLCCKKDREDPNWRKIAMFNSAGALVQFLRTFGEVEFRSS